jgi:hypothetical protein
MFPALVLWVSVGVARFQPARVGIISLAGLTIVSLIGTASYYADFHRDDWRGASSYILDQSTEGDAVIFFVPSGKLGFDYYRERSPGKVSPAEENYAFAAGTPEAERNPLYLGFVQAPDPDPHLAERLAQKYDRVWLLLTDSNDAAIQGQAAELQSNLVSVYKTTQDRDFSNMSVLLYELPGAPSPASH